MVSPNLLDAKSMAGKKKFIKKEKAADIHKLVGTQGKSIETTKKARPASEVRKAMYGAKE